jgi:hypothetical protein
VKAAKKKPSNRNDLKASRIAELARKAGRLAKANRKKGYH